MAGRVRDEGPLFPCTAFPRGSDQISTQHNPTEVRIRRPALRVYGRGVDARISENTWSRRRRLPSARGRWWARLVEEVAQFSTSEAFRKVPHNQFTPHNAGHTTGLAATRTQAAAAVEEDVEGGAWLVMPAVLGGCGGKKMDVFA